MKTICLVEISAVLDETDTLTDLYWSNGGYVTQPTDTPANQYYDPIVINDIVTNEAINIGSTPSVSFSDITISNIGREIFSQYKFKGRTINIYQGQINQARSAFTLIYTGVIDNINGSSINSYTIKLVDKMQKLNKPISETTLGGTTANSGQLIPLVFGEVANISPLLIDPVTNQYQVHLNAVQEIIEVRDFGYPITVTNDIAHGKFTLTTNPAGTITCSVRGDKRSGTYNNTIVEIITEIVKNYGGFTDTDIDLTNFSTFASSHTQDVCAYYTSKENILTAITSLADSVEAQIYMTRLGKLSLFQLDFTAPSVITINDYDIIENSFYLSTVLEVQAGIKLNYCQNHAVQKDLQTGITASHKDSWAKDWLLVEATDIPTATAHNIETQVTPVDTALINKAQAQAEADRRLTVWKAQRYVYKMDVMRTDLVLGQTITYNGNDYVILSVSTNFTKGTSSLEVII